MVGPRCQRRDLPHGGKLRIALAFPNTYWVGMSNLGFQTVYRLFNEQPDIVCERVFLPPKQELAAQLAAGAPLLTLESQTPVREFDVFAFSVSFGRLGTIPSASGTVSCSECGECMNSQRPHGSGRSRYSRPLIGGQVTCLPS